MPRPFARRRRPAFLTLAALAATAAGCSTLTPTGSVQTYLFGPYLGTTATSFMNHIETATDPNIRYLAFAKLANPRAYDDDAQRLRAVRLMLRGLERDKDGYDREPTATRAVICRSLGELGRPEAIAALREEVYDTEPVVRTEACRALGKVGRPEDASLLAQVVAADQNPDCRVAAIDGLAELKAPEPRYVDMLVEGLENNDPAIRWASLRALRKITGKDLGDEVAPWRKLIASRKAPEPRPAPAATLDVKTPAAVATPAAGR
ncbi:MAG TPA: HEAT repeat domain-containing protein [Isosphaeraceae bacterium]|nr:HEAT repeat domain-containing protein [Isosphaeraceae bacterium]